MAYFIWILLLFTISGSEALSLQRLCAIADSSSLENSAITDLSCGLFHEHRRNRKVDYPYNPHIPIDLWNKLKPYFLPYNHPIRKKLDQMFLKKRIIESPESFLEAGFGDYNRHHPLMLFFGKHKELKGYVIKAYLDTQPIANEWENWMARIEGASAIREYIKVHKCDKFCVPHKWIYPLPENPAPAESLLPTRKYFILIAEDMDILNHHETKKAYLKIEPPLLDQLYWILYDLGLIDSVSNQNIPFTRNGKIAFVDTEHHHHPPSEVNFWGVLRLLSAEMKLYWQQLRDQYESGR